MFPRITLIEPGRLPIYLEIREPLVVGRECEGLLVRDDRVSRRHIGLRPGDENGRGQLFVKDLGSMNGTFVDGARFEGEVRVAPGQIIALGEIRITVDPVGNPV